MQTVLILSIKDYAGSGFQMAKAINQCSTKYKAIHAAYNKPNFEAEHGIISPNVKMLIEKADIIHLKGDQPPSLYRQNFQGKKIIATVGGSSFRKPNPKVYTPNSCLAKYNIENFNGTPLTGITPELLNSLDTWLPHTIDVKENLWQGKNAKYIISHAPSCRSKKGTEIIIEACEKMRVPLTLIEGKTNQECLQIKSKSLIFIDQIYINAYGMNTVEAVAMGIPTISSRYTIPNCPIYRVQKPTVDNVMTQIQIALTKSSKKESDKFFNYAKKIHSFEAFTARVEKVYDGLTFTYPTNHSLINHEPKESIKITMLADAMGLEKEKTYKLKGQEGIEIAHQLMRDNLAKQNFNYF